MEQLSKVRSSIIEGKDWDAIAEFQKKTYFTKESLKKDFDEMMKLADNWSSNTVDALFDGFKCASCQGEAVNRCIKCKTYWYCGRECQVSFYLLGVNFD